MSIQSQLESFILFLKIVNKKLYKIKDMLFSLKLKIDT